MRQRADAVAHRRVGVFVGSYLPYSETFIHDQLRSHRRFRAAVFAYERLPGSARRFPFAPVHALCGADRMVYWVTGRARAFDAAIRAERPELLHAHFGTNGVYAAAFARRHRLPLVVTFHGHDVPALVGRARFTARYARYAALAGPMLRQAALLLPASRDLADRLIRDVGADARKVEVLPLGVDAARFDAMAQRDRAPMVLRDSAPTVLMVGRLVEKKGHLYGLRAFAAAHARVPDARLVLIGDGPLRRDVLWEIDRLGIGAAVHLTGPLSAPAVASWMLRAHVLCCPSVTAQNGDVESGVIVVKEAAAAALPTVGTRHGGIPELIVDGETGVLVDERDVARTADALVRLLSDSGLREQMGRAARDDARRRFDLRRQVARLEDLYDAVG